MWVHTIRVPGRGMARRHVGPEECAEVGTAFQIHGTEDEPGRLQTLPKVM